MTADEMTPRIDGLGAVAAVRNALRAIDPRLIDHGERVAFIACELLDEGRLPLNEKQLILLSVFHDIGAYKTEEIDRMVEFETHDVNNHSIYGYFFLKHMSPLGDVAEAILYHHKPWRDISLMDGAVKEYANLIFLADRMDIAFLHSSDAREHERLIRVSEGMFKPEYIELASECMKTRGLYDRIRDGSYERTNSQRIDGLDIRQELAVKYLEMLVFSIDFRSEHTVTHTVNTIAIALNIAAHFGIDKAGLDDMYLGTLLHDVGKIAIPYSILEREGPLSAEEMEIMRTHVKETENIISGIVPEHICRIAVRHHEKLDGSGYPYGLTGDELNFSERITAVADIVSALISKRSYKEPFPKERILEILRKMQGSRLDGRVCEYVCDNYDDIMWETSNRRNAVIQKYQTMLDEYSVLKN